MKLGLYIIGDEILSGFRQDKHLHKIIHLLKQRGHSLAWAMMISDDVDLLATYFKESISRGETVLSTGGIGGTPDDLTRLAVAKALSVPIEAHPEGVQILQQKYGKDLTGVRQRMVEFPQGATLIPNPVNQVPGFSIAQHHFVPGFVEMAWPMLEWVLDSFYAERGEQQQELVVKVVDVYESRLIPLMEQLMRDHPHVKVFSPP